MWIWLTLIYGIVSGIYNVLKKAMMKNSSFLSSLTLATTFSFVFVLWRWNDAMAIDTQILLPIIIKSAVLTVSWLAFMIACKGMDVSKISLIHSISIVLSFVGGILIFNEDVSYGNIFGAVIVFIAVILSTIEGKSNSKYAILPVIFAFLYSITNASSALLDKYILQTATPGQNQFWFLFFVTVFLWIITAIVSLKNKESVIKKTDFKNIYIYIAAISLVLCDSCLFWAYSFNDCKVAVVSVVSQLKFIVTFTGGILFFKERKTLLKFISLFLIIVGIVISIVL